MTNTNQPKSWRDVIEVHPAADLFPMMTADELKALGEDIRKNGLMSSIAITTSKKLGGSWEYLLLDGRNRLDAMEAVGLPVTISLSNGQCRIATKAAANIPGFDTYDGTTVKVVDDDPYAYVISANVHRRHLTTLQRIELVEKVIKANPAMSSRRAAKLAGVSPTTGVKARHKLEAAGDVSTVDTSIDTKGRKQPTRKPATKKNHDDIDGIAEKTATTTATNADAPALAPASPEPNIVDCIEPANDMPAITPTDAIAPKKTTLNLTDYYRRVDKLQHQIFVLVSQHRKWMEARSADSFSALQDTLFLDAVLSELGVIMRAIETGVIDEIDKAHREANKHISTRRATGRTP